MATTFQTTRTTPTRQRLSPAVRKGVLVTHIVSGIGWMGLDVGLFILLLTGLTTNDAAKAASSYNAVAIVVPVAVPVLSLAMLGSGVLLGWGTKWGLLRYWWVFVKLVIGIVLNILVFIALVPEVRDLDSSDSTMTADAIRDRLGDATSGLMFPPIVSFLMLLVSSILSVYKPWGKTSWTRDARR